jgi:anti-sigma-K factor RskA
MTCDERRELLFLFAAGELEDGERDELRAHISDGCPQCLGALAEAEAAIARLASEIAPVNPPEGVRRALAARVALESRMLSPESLAPARRARGGRLRPAVAATIAALAAAGVVALVAQNQLLRAERDANTRHAALDLIGSPYMRAIELQGPAIGFQGHGHLYWDYHSGGCYLRVTAMQAPAAGKVYVLWFSDADGAPIRAGVLELSRDGEATLLTDMPREIDVTGQVMVTAESDGKTLQPSTSDAVLKGELQIRHF